MVILPEPRFTTVMAVPTAQDTEVLLAMVKVRFEALVE
jgi:hypothetical protein